MISRPAIPRCSAELFASIILSSDPAHLMPGAAGTVLVGRQREQAVIDKLLLDVRSGRSRALVLRGEPGVGKTALLDEIVARAEGMAVVRLSGVESEAELAFAGLHQLLVPVLELVELLPAPQRRALEVAFGIASGPEPDLFLV